MTSTKRAPRFNSFSPSSASASLAKSHNRAKDTVPEVLLRKALWRRGIRYRLHMSQLPGKPDIIFTKARVVVFIDGDFWHGRHWDDLKSKLKNRANSEYWIAKIEYNRMRDQEQRRALENQGWTVVRLWETEVIKDAEKALEEVIMALNANIRAQH
ncbi:very short patch repair endonuclease [Desulforhabdus sp. TSK]|uniref:very short patch repair endonuclease n=1 Tax=Desulforhabdus sp. TSK TaxID=2925014 RepID=UPI001FC8BD79|nr:very short patch repair endonuclease [Desulforhabdus sp. TSK]GKT10780.1 very short patch repair endonuclease [Desulforhabdus sp. TSK]